MTIVLHPDTAEYLKRESRLKCVPYGYVVDEMYAERLAGNGKAAGTAKAEEDPFPY